jgi:hypothetical protein
MWGPILAVTVIIWLRPSVPIFMKASAVMLWAILILTPILALSKRGKAALVKYSEFNRRIFPITLKAMVFAIGFVVSTTPLFAFLMFITALIEPLPVWLGFLLFLLGVLNILGGIIVGYRLSKIVPAFKWPNYPGA